MTYIDDPSKFPVATVQHDIVATQTGYIASMETQKIGITAGVLGAGREKKDSVIEDTFENVSDLSRAEEIFLKAFSP